MKDNFGENSTVKSISTTIDTDDEVSTESFPKEIELRSDDSFRSRRSSDDHSMDSLFYGDDEKSPWNIRRSARNLFSQFNPDVSARDLLKDNKTVQELTINKLKYDAIDIIGREKETDILVSSIDRSLSEADTGSNKRKQLIFIKGYSGVGKSTLVRTAEKHVAEIESGMMVQGKFDLINCEDPYSGIAAVFGEVCMRIKSGPNNQMGSPVSSIGDTIVRELGPEVALLTKLIPELAELIPSLESSPNPAADEDNNNFKADFERLKYAFRLLTRVLSSCFAPMVLVLDDLQWADASSLEAIDFLLSDTQNSNGLVIVGLYRSNEVDETHFLSRKIKDLDIKKEMSGFEVTDLELHSLQVSEINIIIMALLSIDDEESTKGLAGICFRRTLGNPFFVIEFVAMLVEEGLIAFNLGLLKWVWDQEEVENETMSTSNVVDLLQARMKKLPKDIQLLLQYAACLGSSFKFSTLDLVWTRNGISVDSTSTGKVSDLLSVVEEANFIESCGNELYRWVHDKVQEAALSLGDAGTASFQFEVGSTLYRGLPDDELEDALFDVVNLINKGNVRRRPEFATLNLRAAEKARSTSAFQSAAVYASNGMKLLPSNKWSAHRALTLSLYTLGAEMELALGRDETMELYSKEVLSQKDLSSLEKLPIYISQSHKLCNVDLQYGATIDLSVAVLKELGSPIAQGALLPFRAIHALLKTVRAAKKKPKASYETPKVMTDPKLQAAMLFLSRIFYASYFTSNDFLLVLSACKMVKMTLDHGVTPLSGQAYASLGLVVNALMGDYETSSYFAETGLLIQSIARSKYTESQTLFISSAYILSWTKPLQSCLMPLALGHANGMKSGNIEYAMWCLNGYHYTYPYQMGKPLTSIDASSLKLISQMEDLRQNDQALLSRIWSQFVLNLMGYSENRLLLKGTVFNPEDFVFQTHVQVSMHAFMQADLYMFFGEYELAADSALARGNDFCKSLNAHSLCMLETFHRGVALYAMARRTKKRKYKIPAQRIRKTVGKWVESGNPNVKHYYSLLSAEDAAMKGRRRAAETHYKEAIRSAARTGHLHHAGLFNERYADFLRHDRKDVDEAKYRIGEAIRWYREWGAVPKVEMLMKAL
jgi:predicted ATPase